VETSSFRENQILSPVGLILSLSIRFFSADFLKTLHPRFAR